MKRFFKIVFAIIAIYIIISVMLSACVSLGIGRRHIIGRRAPFFVSDVAFTTVDNYREDGLTEGFDHLGNYIAFYNARPGDKVITIMFYNPLTNWNDDIIARYDITF